MQAEPDRLAKPDTLNLNAGSNELLNDALEALEFARVNDSAGLPVAAATVADLLIRDGQFAAAADLAAEILALRPNSKHAAEALMLLAVCRSQTSQVDDAALLFHRAIDLSRNLDYPIGTARALHLMTRYIHIPRGEFHIALAQIDEASLLLEEQAGKQWDGSFLRGLIYQIVGDRRHCHEVLDELIHQIEPGTRLAAAYYFLWARLAMDEGEPEQAREYLRLSRRVSIRIGKTDLDLMTGLEFSRYHRMQNEADAARNWADNTLQNARLYQLDYYSGLALIERAQANWAAQNAPAALADLNEAMRLLEPLQAAYDLARARFLLALWLQQSADPRAEETWLETMQSIIQGGYAFILEKEQDLAFPLIAAHMRSKAPKVRKGTEELLRHLASVPPPPLKIASLGQFAIWKDRRRINDAAWNRRKAGELLRFLLLQSNRATGREVIIEALWPDHNSDSPGDLLHQATSALRHALEPDLPDKFPSRYIKVEGERIALALPHGSEVDFENFERVLPLAISTGIPERLQEALNLYAGDLFPSDRYSDWSEEKRQLLAEMRQRGLLALAQAYKRQGQNYNTITCCRHILQADHWNEDAVLLAMQAYIGVQDAPHALKMFQDLERTLKNDLDIVPRADLRELAQSLRNR